MTFVSNNVFDYLKGEYLGVEHILKNSGWHLLGNILNSEELKEELERITGQLYKIKPNIDIDGDGKIDVKLEDNQENGMQAMAVAPVNDRGEVDTR